MKTLGARLGLYGILLVFLFASLGNAAHNADSARDVYDGIYKGQYGHFSHWSAALNKGQASFDLEHAVCNLHESTPLIFSWTGPNVSVGEGGRLPTGKCFLFKRSVPAVETDHDTVIRFTQAGRRYGAEAHIAKLDLPLRDNLLPRALRNVLRTFYAPALLDAPQLADLEFNQSRDGGVIRHTVSWYPPNVSIAIARNAFGGIENETIVKAISGAGYEARVSTLQESVKGIEALGSERFSEPVILISKNNKSPNVLSFTTESSASNVRNSAITLFDRDSGTFLVNVEATSFAVKQ